MAKSIRQLLDHARDFHHQLSAYCTQLGDQAEQMRVRMLLDYLRQHEDHLESCLASYEANADRKVLDYCMKFSPADVGTKCFKDLTVKPGMSVADVMDAVLQVDECLLRYYRQIAEEATAPEVRELFSQLAKLEQSEERLMARRTIEAEAM
ncbi:MAG: hypothetical protein K8T26_20705 [Lentisphaerae bacterium]|nr:hypothetical protein [Lentisphaerota bacterium]